MSENPMLPTHDAFANGETGPQSYVHIRIQQRNGRKTLTTIQGLSEDYDFKKIVKACKKEFACNGTVVDHAEYGRVIQLQGDQRNNVCNLLCRVKLCKEDQIKLHGF